MRGRAEGNEIGRKKPSEDEARDSGRVKIYNEAIPRIHADNDSAVGLHRHMVIPVPLESS
jgi:hypothetical protein